MKKIITKEIPRFNGYYIASSDGKIIRNKPGYGTYVGKVLSPKTINGYEAIVICINRVTYDCLVHVLVVEAFLGPKPKGYEVNHKDLDKTNNHYKNLEYLTGKDNTRHAIRNGHKGGVKGEKHYNSKLTWKKVRKIKRLVAKGWTRTRIGKLMNYHSSGITRIMNGEIW